MCPPGLLLLMYGWCQAAGLFTYTLLALWPAKDCVQGSGPGKDNLVQCMAARLGDSLAADMGRQALGPLMYPEVL